MQYRLLAILFVFLAACSSDDEPVDCETAGPGITLGEITNATSCSAADGSVVVDVSGGVEPYQLFVNGQAAGTNASLTGLTAGTYSITVTDANNCSALLENVTILSQDFSFTTVLQANTSCLTGNGAVTVDVVQINPPYLFKIADGEFADDNFFTGLKTGNHMITIKDNNNCTVTLSITIPQGVTGTSWTNDIKPIMEKSCAITGCHNGVSRSNDFREYASVKSFAKSIKSKTQDRSMPFDGSLTQNQIDLIACWVADGALLN
jgi:hypothetical protein